MSVTVLLTNTSWWPSSALVALALADAGVRVAAVYPRRGHALAKTTAVTQRFVYRATSPLKSLRKAIHAARPDLLLPCDDRAVSHLHRLHRASLAEGVTGRALADLIERSLGSPDAYEIVSSRGPLLRSAMSEGLAVAKMAEVKTVEALRRWGESESLPWVLKVDGSWGGLGVKVVYSLVEAEACFQRMREPLRSVPMLKRLVVNRDAFWMEAWWGRQASEVTVQSYIKGRPANCVIFCREGKVLAGIAVEVVSAQNAQGPATVVRIVEGKQMLAAAHALAARLKLSGFHGLDFMLEEGSGTAYLIELNPRCALPCHLRLQGGGALSRDLVGSLYAELAGQRNEQTLLEPVNGTVSYFPQAWLSDPKGDFLATYHDVPWSEPELVKELLLLPWPDRSRLAQLSDRLRRLSLEDRSARRVVFDQSQTAIDLSRATRRNGESV